MRCTLGAHQIVGEPKYFTDQRHLNFVKKSRREFRPEYGVCADCYNKIIQVYEMKRASAINKLKHKRLISRKQCISDPSISSTNASSRSCNDSYDRMVFKTPRNPSLTHIVSEIRLETIGNNGPSSERSSTNSSSGSDIIFATQSENLSSSNTTIYEVPTIENRLPSSRNQPSPLDTQPSTSAAAALRRRKSGRGGSVLTDSPSNVTHNVYDTWDDVPSPAALNGTRLPHVQPILKRKGQQIVRVNKDKMSVYLKDISGG